MEGMGVAGVVGEYAVFIGSDAFMNGIVPQPLG